MYAGAVYFVLGPDKQWEVERIADVTYGLIKKQRGFSYASFFMNYETGDCAWVGYFDSEEAIRMAYDAIIDDIFALVGDDFQWAPSVQMYEVYEPRNSRHSSIDRYH